MQLRLVCSVRSEQLAVVSEASSTCANEAQGFKTPPCHLISLCALIGFVFLSINPGLYWISFDCHISIIRLFYP